ncbi:DUF3892 domain-containing protein [Anaerovorax odorimutans]|uniref:DUF3892 domain-containing protein n=1 Tax=Anaerovorax odorimutans TaxID=109327 RepID=UPI00040AC75F|nr:DUF3892 domain-containing protein [Anaerovorax odorimutans]
MNNFENGMIGNLPAQINKEIPNPDGNAENIVKLIKEKGRVIGYQLSSGEKVSKEKGIQMAKEGKIKGVAVAENKGNEYLRTLPDASEENNLSNLSSI